MSPSSATAQYVQVMCQGFRPEKAKGLSVVYHLRLTGSEGGDWTITIADEQCRISAGIPARADARISMAVDDYLKLAAGRLDVRQAYLQGQIQIEGSQQLALKFVELFRPWASFVTPGPAPTEPPAPPAAPTPPEPAPAPAEPTLSDYVRTMPNGFRSDRAGRLKATYEFRLSGVDGGIWTVTIADGDCSVSKVQTDRPNVVISMSDSDFVKLAEGKLNTTDAYRQGRLSTHGDLDLAAEIPSIFTAWADTVTSTPFPTPPPVSTPQSQPQPKPSPRPTPKPSTGSASPQLMNGSFDEYQPYIRKGEAKVWKEDRFPEQYGAYWSLETIYEKSGQRFHLMDSGIFGQFTQKYFGGGGRDYHIHGRHSQVIASRYRFDLAFYQTVAAQPGRDYTLSGSIVSFFQGTSGPPVHGKIFKTIGIDPTGGRDYRADSVVWGERDGRDNEWRYPSLKVKAQAEAITVFIRLENEERDVGQTELNIIHLDNFRLE